MNIHSENISSANPTPIAGHLKPSTEEIKFATGKSELGAVLVARSAAGVCAILIGDGTEVLKRDLAEKFTDAKLVRDDWALRDYLRRACLSDWRTARDPCRRERLRGQRNCLSYPVSSCG